MLASGVGVVVTVTAVTDIEVELLSLMFVAG